MEFRPLSYDEMCKMEMLHGGVSSGTTAMLPVMVIPSSVVGTGGGILTATAAQVNGNDPSINYYQLQPTHLLTTSIGDGNSGRLSPPKELHKSQTKMSAAVHPHTQYLVRDRDDASPITTTTTTLLIPSTITEQIPPPPPPHPESLRNVLYHPGATTHLQQQPHAASTLTRKVLESSAVGSAQRERLRFDFTDEGSDIDGSETGASSTATTTCIPHFRFGGCGMILQQAAALADYGMAAAGGDNANKNVSSHAFSSVIGTGAAGSGAEMLSGGGGGRGTAGITFGVVGSGATLGRNRTNRRCIGVADGSTQTLKRVSFKGDANVFSHQQERHHHQPQYSSTAGGVFAGSNGAKRQDLIMEQELFNNCSYMSFDNFMDYQTTGFGGLPDVTEHSNIRRTLSRQNSISNSDSGGEIASIQKAKTSFGNSKAAIDDSRSGPPHQSCKNAQNGTGNGLRDQHKSKRIVCIFGLTLMAAICMSVIAASLAYQHYFMASSRNSHEQRLKIVRRILKDVPLVDGHNNFAWNVRKYAHSSLELVHLSHDLDHSSIWTRPAWAQTDIERLKVGLMGVQVWSAYIPCEAQGLDAVQLALEQIDIIHRLNDMYAKDTVLVTSYQDILAARRQGLMASLIGIEGGHAIGSSLGVLRSFYSLGARYLSLTHKCDISWAGSSSSTLEHGLTQFGKAVIKEMNRLGMMIDLSHSSDATARDVVQVTRAPVIFSHSAARQLCNSTRNIPDDVLRLVADNGGLIMISFDSEDVSCGRPAKLQDVIAHIKYIRSIAGIQHIGIGAGYDGIEQPPIGLEDVSKYPDLLATLLEDSNWSEEDIAMLAGKNFLRVLKSVENVRDYWKRAAIQPVESTEQQQKTHCTYMAS